MAIFIHLYLNQVYFVSTVLVTDLVVASTFLIIVGGGLLVIAALIGFVAVATKCQRVIAAVRRKLAKIVTVNCCTLSNNHSITSV